MSQTGSSVCQVPRVLTYKRNSQPLGVPAVFSGSTLGNPAFLAIAGLRAEDKTSRYCPLYDTTVEPAWLRARPQEK
ncbi:hypothetical protein CB1_000302022 [Camelus ferus]|nr:hypothetical protein CB1_000302022 [Camelus ferus]